MAILEAAELTTEPFRCAFVHVMAPHKRKQKEGEDVIEPKYEIVMLVPKDGADIKPFRKAVNAMGREFFKDRWDNEVFRKRIRTPIVDGDEVNEGLEAEGKEPYDGHADHWVVRCSSKSQPFVVDEDVRQISDAKKIYSGCWVRVNINAYAYDNKSKGIAFGLNMVQFVKDDTPFGGARRDPKEVFQKIKKASKSQERFEDDDEDEPPRKPKKRARDNDEDLF